MSIRARFLVLSLGLALGPGCIDPALVQEKTRAFEAGLLEFIQEGRTTRQEILLRLGAPSAAFEGGRILTYDFVMEPSGEWRRVGATGVSGWSTAWPRTASLVLVFGPEDRLVRQNLVKDPRSSERPPQEAAASPQGQVP
ncbi:MAG: hypothetical protein U0P46_11755 [Holophagaceae bacterium]